MVIWTPRAQADLKAIYQHIYKDSPFNAKSVTERILASTAKLVDFLGTHKTVPESRHQNIHEMRVSAWRVIYHPRDNNIHIIAIVHKRRILKANMIEY